MRVGGRKVLAVLAGGVVLAGGGVTTLAAWQDQTSDRAPLTLSRFNVQQTLDPAGSDGSFVEAEAETEAGASSLLLQVGASATALLSPGSASTGWVGLRVDAGSVGGTVTLNGATVGPDASGLGPQLQYEAVAGVSEATCRSGNLPATGVLVAANSALTTGSGANTFTLQPGASASVAGPMVGVCIKLSLRPTVTRALSGSSVSPVWTFSATSAS